MKRKYCRTCGTPLQKERLDADTNVEGLDDRYMAWCDACHTHWKIEEGIDDPVLSKDNVMKEMVRSMKEMIENHDSYLRASETMVTFTNDSYFKSHCESIMRDFYKRLGLENIGSETRRNKIINVIANTG